MHVPETENRGAVRYWSDRTPPLGSPPDDEPKLIAGAADEIRAPVEAIHAAVRTLRREDLDERSRQRLLDLVEAECTRVRRTVNTLVRASIVEAGSQTQVDEVDAAAIASELTETLGIRFEAPEVLPPVLGDADEVRQVLEHLLDNAVKYSPDRSGVSVVADADERVVRISVHDEGLGIPPGTEEWIFDPFSRLDPQLEHGVAGAGLGLYVARGLARSMGGDVVLVRREGPGSTFALLLPQAR